MESETQRLVGLFGARVVEEVVNDVVADGKEGAAGRVGRGVLAVGASNATSKRSCKAE